MILLIDTSGTCGTIAISVNGKILDSLQNTVQADHASFLQPAIKELLKRNNTGLHELQAIAVNSGPGSYTGLRVSLASAKGLSYALNLPFLLINSLEIMALTVIHNLRPDPLAKVDVDTLICPMIDARRMEVYTAAYDMYLNEIMAPSAMILDENSFNNFSEKKIIFTGDGTTKFFPVFKHRKINDMKIEAYSDAFALLAQTSYDSGRFADLAYAEPTYLKGIYIK